MHCVLRVYRCEEARRLLRLASRSVAACRAGLQDREPQEPPDREVGGHHQHQALLAVGLAAAAFRCHREHRAPREDERMAQRKEQRVQVDQAEAGQELGCRRTAAWDVPVPVLAWGLKEVVELPVVRLAAARNQDQRAVVLEVVGSSCLGRALGHAEDQQGAHQGRRRRARVSVQEHSGRAR